VAHTIRQKTKLLNRVRRIRGQVTSIEAALESQKGCAEVLHLVAAVRGAINALMSQVMEDHIRFHIVDPAREPESARGQSAAELIDAVHAYLQ
jgi:FrmR/RcnR family transcriptional regulator, repressor of frmRAB operon